MVICPPMANLTGSQRRFLRSRAHVLKPAVQIGQSGLTDSALAEIDRALNRHELIKVKFGDFKDRKKELTEEIVTRLGSEQVGLVGHMLILFRRNPNPEERQIKLPD